MTGTAHRSRNSSLVSTNSSYNASPSANAALYGATKAFAASSSPNAVSHQTQMNRNDSITNGAHSAAARAGLETNAMGSVNTNTLLKSSSSAWQQPTGSRRDEVGRARTNTLGASLDTPPRAGLSRSPSSIAASLAASRVPPSPSTMSVSPTASVKHLPAAKSPAGTRSISLNVAAGQKLPQKPRISLDAQVRSDRPDESPIPPTSSLRQLFEQKDKSVRNLESQQNRAPPPTIAIAHSAPIQSPKPVRKSLILKDDAQPMPMFEDGAKKMPASPPEKLGATPALKVPKARSTDPPLVGQSARPTPPPARRRGKAENVDPSPLPSPEPVALTEQRRSSLDARRTAPIPIKQSRTPAFPGSSLEQTHSITAAFNQLHPRRLTPLRTGDSQTAVDSLANAIVASSLASTRAPSPTKLPAPPPKPTHHHHHGLFSGSLHSHTASPSPPKRGMRHTMRKDESSSESSDEDPYAKHKKKKRIRKHPNKHHEGSRKRWRDAVTERERKRYEGVWAANKGLHTTFCPSETQWLEHHPRSKESQVLQQRLPEEVSNVVVRDIWSRSRLPAHVLEEVWSLVDGSESGRLSKEEFVVGLWLVDQRLKGRKLPAKVSESVWRSVRFLQGIKIRG